MIIKLNLEGEESEEEWVEAELKRTSAWEKEVGYGCY